METQPHNQDEPAAVDSPRIKQAIGEAAEAAVATYEAQRKKKGDRDE